MVDFEKELGDVYNENAIDQEKIIEHLRKFLPLILQLNGHENSIVSIEFHVSVGYRHVMHVEIHDSNDRTCCFLI